MPYPASLREILDLFADLPEQARREMLISFADSVGQYEPLPEETFSVVDSRKDVECLDEVGIFANRSADGRLLFRIRLGPKVQTLTKALAAILCQGLSGLDGEQVAAVPEDFVRQIVGGELARLRSQTVYYILGRMKEAARQLPKNAALGLERDA